MITYKRDTRKRRPTRKQIGQTLDLFRPSPTITATVKQIKLTPKRGNLRGFADVELSLHGWQFLLLRGVRIVQQDGQRAWVQMPHQRSTVDGNFYPIAKSLDPELFTSLKTVVLDAYQGTLGGMDS